MDKNYTSEEINQIVDTVAKEVFNNPIQQYYDLIKKITSETDENVNNPIAREIAVLALVQGNCIKTIKESLCRLLSE